MFSDTLWQSTPPDDQPQLSTWLADTGSLTERLQGTGQPFSVSLLWQGLNLPFPDEPQLLATEPGTEIYVRHVALMLGAIPVIFARSITAPHNQYWREVLERGNRSLGLTLFGSQGNIKRHALLYRAIQPDHPLFILAAGQDNTQASRYPARRSNFIHADNILNVCEVFLPALKEFL